MQFYNQTIFLDQFSPVSIYQKIKQIFTDEITFLFESVVNGDDGNFSYIFVGDRERIWHKDNLSYYKNEQGKIKQIDTNPFLFLKEYYNKIDKQLYKQKGYELENLHN